MTENWTVITKDEADKVLPIIRKVANENAHLAIADNDSDDTYIKYWFGANQIAALTDDENIMGFYYLKPNNFTLGAHIANAGYLVDPDSQGKGVGRKLAEHSIRAAKEKGFRAMQFNCVACNNESAVRLWKSLGFRIIGTTPGGFYYKKKEYVDSYIMFKELV